MPRRSTSRRGAALFALLVALGACSHDESAPTRPPNVLWIVWDTVRADHLSLYGYTRPTTPFLSEWAKGARVFDDALSVAGYTLPSHASLFTGLLPSEHCVSNENHWLSDSFTTLAELLRDAGYRTFLFSANPHVAAAPGANLAQGFERAEHPWSPKWLAQAKQIVRGKLAPEDRSHDLARRRERPPGRTQGAWDIQAAGEIAQQATLAWLGSSDREQPFFVFLNYMEAHSPLMPPRRLREKLLSEADVERSYRVDRSTRTMWEYTFGLREYSDADLELTRATYDAAVLELDALLQNLLAGLGDAGFLENTVVILTADHGELLGEAHMLGHQYSLHQALLHVPLVIHAPNRLAPGRDARPVASFDLFPTLLELTGIAPPAGLHSHAVSLLTPSMERQRLAESPVISSVGIAQVKRRHPDFDATPFRRRISALVADSRKLLWGSDGRNAVYDLARDPLETRDLLASEPALAAGLEAKLEQFSRSLTRCDIATLDRAPKAIPRQQREMLEALGYLDDEDGEPTQP